MYSPQSTDLDFEIGAFGDRLKKGFKKATKALDKVTEYTITKPSMMIGGAIGGKKGRELGRKLGGITSMATKVGVGAGAAGALLPIATSPMGVTAITAGIAGKAGKKLLGKKKRKAKKKNKTKRRLLKRAAARAAAKTSKAGKHACMNAEAAKVASLLVAKFGKPLSEANKMLKLAELQREATYEHRKLMTDAEFRKRVLSGIAGLAADGHTGCERTIRVLVGR